MPHRFQRLPMALTMESTPTQLPKWKLCVIYKLQYVNSKEEMFRNVPMIQFEWRDF